MNVKLNEYLKIEKGKVPVYLQAYRKLRKLIVDGYFNNGDKMISEGELADIMDIGRTSLRTALVLLYEDGYIVTKQGKGSYVTYDPDKQVERYPNQYISLKKRLETTFSDVTIETIFKKEVTDDAFLDQKLNAKGKKICYFANMFYANSKPLVYNQLFFIDGLANNNDELQLIFEKRVSYVTSTFTVTSISDLEYTPSEFSVVTNVLLVSSTWYDENNIPIAYSKDYFDNDAYKYRIRQSVI